jgi:HEXXH motif-containing protein
MSVLALTAGQLDSLARLRDEPTVLPLLQRARVSRNIAFLAAIVRSGGRGVPPESWRLAQAGFDALVDIQHRAPGAVRRVLDHPRFGAWSALCAGDPTGEPGPEGAVHAVAHLASFAATAAVTAGLDFELELPVVADAVIVPAVGCWTGLSGRTAVLRRGRSGAAPELAGASPRGGPGPTWTGIRTLSSTGGPGAPAATVEFDDLPATPAPWSVAADGGPAVRDRSPEHALRWPRTPVSGEDHRYWQLAFDAGVRLLGRTVPDLAEPLCRGMRVLLPLEQTGGPACAVTLADAFGLAAMTRPHDTAAAATSLLHEFQHSKLSVLSELVPLISTDQPEDLYSPWRREARPASAVLHGAFAHLSIALLCARTALDLAGDAAHEASAYGELVRIQTAAACENLLSSGRLTSAGHCFVGAMAETAAGIGGAFPAPRAHRAAAQDALDRHRAAWLSRNSSETITPSRSEQRS